MQAPPRLPYDIVTHQDGLTAYDASTDHTPEAFDFFVRPGEPYDAVTYEALLPFVGQRVATNEETGEVLPAPTEEDVERLCPGAYTFRPLPPAGATLIS